MPKLNLRILLVAVVSITCLHVTAQKINNPRLRLTIDIGAIHAVGLNDNIDSKSSITTGFSLEKPFYIKDRLYLTTGIGMNSQRYFIDAYFVNNGNGIILKPVENGITNNKIVITSLKIPLLLCIPVFTKKDKAIALSAGADIDFFIHGERQYKPFNGNNQRESFSFERKIQLPLRIEISTLNLTKQKGLDNLFYGFGVKQQLTNFNKTNSFRPFEAYLRLGIQF